MWAKLGRGLVASVMPSIGGVRNMSNQECGSGPSPGPAEKVTRWISWVVQAGYKERIADDGRIFFCFLADRTCHFWD